MPAPPPAPRLPAVVLPIACSCTRYYDGCKTHDAKDGQITSDNNNNDDNDDNDDSCTPSQDVGYCTRHQFPAQNCSIWWDGCKWCQRLERRPQLVTCVRTACTSAADAMEPKCYRAHGNGSGGKACALYFDDCNMCRQCEDEQQVLRPALGGRRIGGSLEAGGGMDQRWCGCCGGVGTGAAPHTGGPGF